MDRKRVVGLDVVSDDVVGQGGFLAVRRLRMRNQHGDGTFSREYLVDFLVRPKGLDAVVVVAWRRAAGGGVEVLLRDGLRPPLALGRAEELQVVPDGKRYLFFREVCAGIVERDDRGEEGLIARAALELEEEAGYRVDAGRFVRLGAGVFPSAGAMPEKFFLVAVEIVASDVAEAPAGDGSPMEEGASLSWLGLDVAIEACVRGEIEDAKTELGLRRLRDLVLVR